MDITTKQQLGSLADRVVEKIRQVASATLDAAQQLDEAKADVNHTHTAAEIGALPASGGTLTGALSVQGAVTATGAVSGTKLKTTSAATATTASQVAVLSGGEIQAITPANLRTAMGAQAVPLHGDVTIPVTGWVNDTTVPGCSKRYDIPITGVTANDQAEIRVKPASMTAAEVLSTTNETVAGKVRIWAAAVPTAAIAAEYWIERG